MEWADMPKATIYKNGQFYACEPNVDSDEAVADVNLVSLAESVTTAVELAPDFQLWLSVG